MQEFKIRLRSVKDVQDFVSIATSRPFAITVRDARNKINAKSFMEMFCLDFRHPLRVLADCSPEQLETLCNDAGRFLTK